MGAAFAVAVVGLPAAHALAAAPGGVRPTHPVAPVSVTAIPQELHQSPWGGPGAWTEEQCQGAEQELRNDRQAIMNAFDEGDDKAATTATQKEIADFSIASSHCLVID
jgi:hypothetical protein